MFVLPVLGACLYSTRSGFLASCMLGSHSTLSNAPTGIYSGWKGNISTQADLALHLSSPPFPSADISDIVGVKICVLVEAEVGSTRSKLQVLCQPKGFFLQGCVFLLCSWEMGTLGLISCHNKGCSGTLLKPDAVAGQSRAVS